MPYAFPTVFLLPPKFFDLELLDLCLTEVAEKPADSSHGEIKITYSV